MFINDLFQLLKKKSAVKTTGAKKQSYLKLKALLRSLDIVYFSSIFVKAFYAVSQLRKHDHGIYIAVT